MHLTLDCHLKQRRSTSSDCKNGEKGIHLGLFHARVDYVISPFKVAILNQNHLDGSITFDESNSLEGINNKVKLSSSKNSRGK